MKRTTKSLLITSLILFCAGLILALCSSVFVMIKKIDAFGVDAKEETIENVTLSLEDILASSPESSFVKKLSNKEFLRVDITSYAGELIIRSAEQTSLELIDTNTANLNFAIVGDTLTISEMDPVGIMGVYIDKSGFSFKGLRQIFGPGNSANTEKKIVLNLAKDFCVDQIDIDSKIGNVSVEGITVDELNISSFIGDVSLRDLSHENCKINLKGNFTDVETDHCVYKNLSVTTKIGDLNVEIQDMRNLSTVLESWIGEIDIETNIPTKEYKLSLATTLGHITRNGEGIGKELRDTSSTANRISATSILGSIDLSFTGGNEEDFVPAQTENQTAESPVPQTGDAIA